MAETVNPAVSRPRYEVRPSPLNTEGAPEEFVDNEAKPATFGDMLDAINPLQQLPFIGSIYRSITGTTIAPAARVIGGVLFGGLAGGLTAVANAVVEEVSGKDMAEHLVAAVAPGEHAPSAPPGVNYLSSPLVAQSADDGPRIQLASFTADSETPRGSIERNGLLTTWIPEAPRAPVSPASPSSPFERDMRVAAVPPGGVLLAGLAPLQPQPPAPKAKPEDNLAATPAPAVQAPQLAAAAPAPAPQSVAAAPSGPAGAPQRGMSLDTYRARALGAPVFAAQMPAVEDRLGLMRHAEAARSLATLQAAQATQQTASAAPAALQAQQAVDISQQSYFAASMERGLERYRQMQQQRDEATRGANGI